MGAEGFLLVCSTQPAASVVKRLEELEGEGKLLARYWDAIELEKRLSVPALFPLIHQFLPVSGSLQPWKIYNSETSPAHWAANFRSYFFYLTCRISNAFPDLHEVEVIADRLESVPLPGSDFGSHYLRLRAVYFDDKHEQFSVFVDYLYPDGHEDDVLPPEQLQSILRSGYGLHSDSDGSWYTTYWDVRYVSANPYSDPFNVDSAMYYEPYMSNFRVGSSRDGWVDELDGPSPPPPRRRRP